jgi:hypothetical protein
MNALEILTKHKLKSKAVLKCKGNGAYLETKHRHDFPLPLGNSSLKLTLTNFSLNKKGFGVLAA